jgi:hypothetical protein
VTAFVEAMPRDVGGRFVVVWEGATCTRTSRSPCWCPKHLDTIDFDFLIFGWPLWLATGVAQRQDVLRPEASAVLGSASRFEPGLDPLPGWEASRLVAAPPRLRATAATPKSKVNSDQVLSSPTG